MAWRRRRMRPVQAALYSRFVSRHKMACRSLVITPEQGISVRRSMSLAVLPQFFRSRLRVFLALLVLPAVLGLTLFLRPPVPAAAGVNGVTDCEPRLPLDIAWHPAAADPSLPGTSLTLVLSARTDLPSVRVELLLPENVSLLSGPGIHEGTLGRGEESRLTLRVSSRGAATLQVRVTAMTPEGLVFRRGARFDLGADGRPAEGPDPGRLLSSPDGGRRVREFLTAGQEVAP